LRHASGIWTTGMASRSFAICAISVQNAGYTLSARREVLDKVDTLGLGADD
jgi:hypothetical protein